MNRIGYIGRVTIAVVLAPTIPAALVALISLPEAFFYWPLFGLPTSVIFGLPAHIILQRMRYVRWGAYVVAGFISAILSESLYLFIAAADNDHPPSISSIWSVAEGMPSLFIEPSTLFIGVLGGIAGLTFWFVVRPDRLAANP